MTKKLKDIAEQGIESPVKAIVQQATSPLFSTASSRAAIRDIYNGPRISGPAERLRDLLEAASPSVKLKSQYESSFRKELDAILLAVGGGADAGKHSMVADKASVKAVSDIGVRVKEARKRLGLTQRDFAHRAGVGRRFVVELEKGKPSLELGLVLKALEAAGLELLIRP